MNSFKRLLRRRSVRNIGIALVVVGIPGSSIAIFIYSLIYLRKNKNNLLKRKENDN